MDGDGVLNEAGNCPIEVASRSLRRAAQEKVYRSGVLSIAAAEDPANPKALADTPA